MFPGLPQWTRSAANKPTTPPVIMGPSRDIRRELRPFNLNTSLKKYKYTILHIFILIITTNGHFVQLRSDCAFLLLFDIINKVVVLLLGEEGEC